MIDVQPYIDKLDKLQEFLFNKIDGRDKLFWVDVEMIPRMNPEQFLRLYAETGLIFCNGNPPPVPIKLLTFEQWYESQNIKPCKTIQKP